MEEISGVTIFLPYNVLKDLSCAHLFGCCMNNQSIFLINSVISVQTDKKLNEVRDFHQFVNDKLIFNSKLQFTGMIYESKKKLNVFPAILDTYYQHPWFILRVNALNHSFHLEKYNSKCNYSPNFVLYDSFELLHSHLLFSSIQEPNSKHLISFLVSSLNNNQQFYSVLTKSINHKFSSYSFALKEKDCSLFSPFITCLEKAIIYLNGTITLLWWFQCLLKLIKLTNVGRQIYQRLLHAGKLILNSKSQDSFDLKRKNLMFALLFDILFGWLFTFFILKSNLPVFFLESTVGYTNDIVNSLQKLIYWLMGVPAGLKLNISLNSALGHFFLYHIYLWEAYMTIVVPLLHFILKISTVIGAFGLTFIFCLMSDLISLATVHIYCFYGYATRLYGYQISCLSALWRLFRGKKWNPLRQRVDSYSYDVHQLYLGTLLFTVLLFLLPTVFVYYFVFMSLRVLVLAIQGLMSKFIEIISILPLYTITMKLLSSPVTNGDIYFSIFSSEATLVLSMKLIQAPFSTVIKQTLPEICKNGKTSSWKELMYNIISGEIIYPL